MSPHEIYVHHHWSLIPMVLYVLLRYTDSDYPFCIFNIQLKHFPVKFGNSGESNSCSSCPVKGSKFRRLREKSRALALYGSLYWKKKILLLILFFFKFPASHIICCFFCLTEIDTRWRTEMFLIQRLRSNMATELVFWLCIALFWTDFVSCLQRHSKYYKQTHQKYNTWDISM